MSRDPLHPEDNAWEDIGFQRGEREQQKTYTPAGSVPGALRPGDAAHLSEADDALNAWSPVSKPPTSNMPPDRLPPSVPDVLRPGRNVETNPFLRKRSPSNDASSPVDGFSKLNLGEPSRNPWHPSTDAPPNNPQHVAPPPIVLQSEESDPWASSKKTSPQPPGSPALMSLPSDDGSGWEHESPRITVQPPQAPPKTAMSDELVEDQHVWDDVGLLDKGKGKDRVDEPAAREDEWNLIDTDSEDEASRPQDGQGTNEQAKQPSTPASAERKKWSPPRQPVDGKTETYQVKNIQWQDLSYGPAMRTSPILVQNANGPCPLVALVNALTLTTPADIPDTALVQTLRSREQVSLNLLLDAVFDELMSPRRTSSEDDLPDVSELYSFLQSLHTGMNVNPRFIPSQSLIEAFEKTHLTNLDVSERKMLIPGTFENTAEMGLYATFSIPLIHGWLPSRSEAVYEASERQAASYEDAQNLLFREEELESKLMSPNGTISNEEQQLYQDILTIKSFLSVSATQLTAWGIKVISKSMRPGTFAIFFRNDHFSTLYCRPDGKHLVTLVTDAGYRNHSKIVWESLVDVNGERTQFLTGDYKPVGPDDIAAGNGRREGNAAPSPSGNLEGAGPTAAHDTAVPTIDQEQEDRDLALALQLQEEEDQRQREDNARRQQERLLSEQFIEQDARGTAGGGQRRRSSNHGLVPERRSSNTVSIPPSTTPPIHPVTPVWLPGDSGPRQPRRPAQRPAPGPDADVPPTYEQAQHDPSYDPPPGHPAHSTSSRSSQVTRNSGTAPSLPQRPGGQTQPMGRRPQAGNGLRERERDCVVM